MNKSLVLALVAVAALLSGCAQMSIDIMSRADGRVYHGMAQKTAPGTGTVSMNVAGVQYTGRYSRTSSEQYMSFVNAYAQNNLGGYANAYGTATTFGSNISIMALLASSDGGGMRCAVQGDQFSGTGGGICIDSRNNVYDAIYRWSGGLL